MESAKRCRKKEKESRPQMGRQKTRTKRASRFRLGGYEQREESENDYACDHELVFTAPDQSA
jgi:hypothetical protein